MPTQINYDRIEAILRSEWLRKTVRPYLGDVKVGLIIEGADQDSAVYTWEPSNIDEAVVFERGLREGISGLIRIDHLDPYWDEARADLDLLDANVASPEELLAAEERVTVGFTSRTFSQLAALTLADPRASNPIIRWLSGFFGVRQQFAAIFVDRKGPDQKVLASHRVYFSGDHWVVTHDLAGAIDAVFVMDAADVKEYIIRLRLVQLAPWYAFWVWVQFAMWYNAWTKVTAIPTK